jgi:hypothetical protein
MKEIAGAYLDATIKNYLHSTNNYIQLIIRVIKKHFAKKKKKKKEQAIAKKQRMNEKLRLR